MATIAPTKPVTVAFPKSDVIAALVAELIEVAKAEAQIRGISLPADNPKIIKAPIPMDSLSVVAVRARTRGRLRASGKHRPHGWLQFDRGGP